MSAARVLSGAVAAAAMLPSLAAAQWSGTIALEARLFTESAAQPGQEGGGASFAIAPEYHRDTDGGRQGVTITPFFRYDPNDPQRTHADLRELLWYQAGEAWELRAGIGKVFWGVTESQHLVDIINQTDGVEDPDMEEKLGQPLIDVAWIGPWGTWHAFVLPAFRERTFPGEEGRLRTHPVVDTGQTQYESSERERHVDWAARWSHYIGDWDIGLSYFVGTSREPRFLPGTDAQGDPVLIPRYDLIRQSGLDVQYTRAGWLWKLEWIHRSGQGEPFDAATGGFEYTWSGALGTRADLGLLAEYLYDDRGAGAPTPFEDDLFLGIRLALNDAASSEMLAGAILDEDGSRLYSVEASRRWGGNRVWRLEGRVFSDAPEGTSLSAFERDDYLQLGLDIYF